MFSCNVCLEGKRPCNQPKQLANGAKKGENPTIIKRSQHRDVDSLNQFEMQVMDVSMVAMFLLGVLTALHAPTPLLAPTIKS